MKVLEELYYGNLCPSAARYENDSPCSRLVALRERNREKLLASLSEKEKEAFEKFIDAQTELDGMTHCEKFSTGFRLGALLVTEAFVGIDERER